MHMHERQEQRYGPSGIMSTTPFVYLFVAALGSSSDRCLW